MKKVTQKQLKEIMNEIGYDILFYSDGDVLTSKESKTYKHDCEVRDSSVRSKQSLDMIYALYKALGYEYIPDGESLAKKITNK